ncbi:alpha/beta-hydrolase [Mycena amicta]|nr:alpha/beta-hydrolase [Mycena amicta]
MDCIDVPYKTVDNVSILLNVYPPPLQTPNPCLPAVVYFHGGGLTVGNRTSWFPTWLKDRLFAAGIVFISADYRLTPSVTMHDIIQDIRDLFKFLSKKDLCFKALSDGGLFTIDPESIAVAGSSAGGACAYQAAIHASPKPKAVLSLYGMLGQAFCWTNLIPKSEVFFLGRELLDPRNFSEFIYPTSKSLPPISDSPLSYHPPTSPTPGWPANPRMPLARLYLQLGVTLDYVTGQHQPSLSSSLRPILPAHPPTPEGRFAVQDTMKAVIPPEHHIVFPQLNITSEFPPTFLFHGEKDSAVPVQESEHMAMLLEKVGVPVRLLVVEGAEHSLDYAPDAEEKYASYFDEMAAFLTRHCYPDHV